MSTDYIRGGMPDPAAALDERLDRFVQSELEGRQDWSSARRKRGGFDVEFRPRGLGRNNFHDGESFGNSNVQRGRVG
jgi:hypothetical protein